MKYASLFSGVGGAELGIRNADPEARFLAHAEYDKSASGVLNFNYNGVKNYGDVSKVDWSQFPKVDLLHASPPCQAFSVAGQQKGMADERGLPMWEAYFKCLEIVRPPVITLEEVPALLSKKFAQEWSWILSEWSRLGYHVKYAKLQALDYGIPQSRNRLIVVGFQDKGRCDRFQFPSPQVRTLKLRDILQPECDVDPKFYLKPAQIEKLVSKMTPQQLDRILTAANEQLVFSQPPKFLDRNHSNIPEAYAMAVDTMGTNGVSLVVNPITFQEIDHSRTQRTGGVVTLSDKHNYDVVGVVVNDGVAAPKPETANCVDASYGKGLDNHGQRTGIAVIVATNQRDEARLNEDDHAYAQVAQEGGRQFQRVIVEDFYPDRNRVFADNSPTLRADRTGLKVVVPSELRQHGTLTDISEAHAPTLMAQTKGGDNEPKVLCVNSGASQHDRIYDAQGVSPTIQGGSGTGFSSAKHPFIVVVSDDGKLYVQIGDKYLAIRRLTPIECERLQSWPDDWTRYAIEPEHSKKCVNCLADGLHKVEQAMGHRYKQVGNGLVSKVITEVVKQVIATV